MKKEVAKVGSHCPHEECEAYGEIEKGNIIKYGKSKQGLQRYYCKSCEGTFNENHGTLVLV